MPLKSSAFGTTISQQLVGSRVFALALAAEATHGVVVLTRLRTLFSEL